MTFSIIGCAKQPFTSKKNGKQYLPIGVAVTDPYWKGIKPDQLLLNEDLMGVASIETENGEIFVPNDGKIYYIDVDYNQRGFMVGCKIYDKSR